MRTRKAPIAAREVSPLASRPVGVQAAWLLFLALAGVAGCGGGTERVPVEGTVTLKGKPLEQGSVTFLSTSSGSSAGARIESGRFDIPRQRGPSPGVYRVEIVAYQETGRKIPDPDRPGEMMDEAVQLVPERYNSESELQVDLSKDGPNQFEFALEAP